MHLACSYYREPKIGELIGYCNDGLAKIPSRTHEDCMCRSAAGIYAGFCPIYAKLQKKELNRQKGNIFRRIFLNGYSEHKHDSDSVTEDIVVEEIHEEVSVG